MSFLLLGVVSSRDGKRIPIIAQLLVTLAFVAIFTVIVDLDRPPQDTVNVSQKAMSDLVQQMMAPGS